MIHKLAPFGLILSWLVLIFSFSSQSADISGPLSRSFTHDILRVIAVFSQDLAGSINADTLHRNLRIFAHFILYFFLGMWVAAALKNVFSDWFRVWLDSSLFALVIAVFDELYQSTIPGRVMSMDDIFTDAFGALLGAGLMTLILFKAFKPPLKKQNSR